jgi:hypothetical protein
MHAYTHREPVGEHQTRTHARLRAQMSWKPPFTSPCGTGATHIVRIYICVCVCVCVVCECVRVLMFLPPACPRLPRHPLPPPPPSHSPSPSCSDNIYNKRTMNLLGGSRGGLALSASAAQLGVGVWCVCVCVCVCVCTRLCRHPLPSLECMCVRACVRALTASAAQLGVGLSLSLSLSRARALSLSLCTCVLYRLLLMS